MSEKKLFKKGVEHEEKKKKGNKLFLFLVALHVKINTVLTYLVLGINFLFIVYMLYDFNVGIMLFVANQYLIIMYFMRIRKEKRRRKRLEEVSI